MHPSFVRASPLVVLLFAACSLDASGLPGSDRVVAEPGSAGSAGATGSGATSGDAGGDASAAPSSSSSSPAPLGSAGSGGPGPGPGPGSFGPTVACRDDADCTGGENACCYSDPTRDHPARTTCEDRCDKDRKDVCSATSLCPVDRSCRPFAVGATIVGVCL